MESAFPTPAPSHATVDIRAAAAARGQATAPHVAAPPSSARAHAAPRRTNAERPTPAAAADEETAAANQDNDEAHDPDGAETDAEMGTAAAASSDEDVEAVTDPKGILGPTGERYNAGLLRRVGSPTRADPDWAERPPPDGIERVAGAIILCKRRRAGDANHETPPLAGEQDADDDLTLAQALLEMEGMLEEYEDGITRPEQLCGQRRFYKRQQRAHGRSHSYGDPFVSQSAARDFEISDGSESDDHLDDEGVQYASHPSQSRKNADASTAFFKSYPQPPSTPRQPHPHSPPSPTYRAARAPHHAPQPPPPPGAMEAAIPPPPPPPRPTPPASMAHTQQPPPFAPPPSIPTWQFPPPPPPPPPPSWTPYAPPPPFRMQEAPVQQTPVTMDTSMAPTGPERPPELSAPDTRKCTAQDGTWRRNLERLHSLGEATRNILHLPLQTSSGTPSSQAAHCTLRPSWPATCNAALAPTRRRPHHCPRAHEATQARMHHQP